MIYLDDHIEDFDLQQMLAAISPQRREQALRYRQECDQRLCLAAYRLLQRALKQEYGIDELPKFTYESSGKPLLAGHPDIHFSLSHCRDAVACALSNSPVGIDVETFGHYSEDVARHVMNDDEMRQILDSPRPDVTFTRLWTMKESFYKLTGNNASGDIPNMLQPDDQVNFTTFIHPNYLCTCCTLKTKQID